MSNKKNGKKGSKSGGSCNVLLVMGLFLGVAGATLWFVAPDQVSAQLSNLKSMLGL